LTFDNVNRLATSVPTGSSRHNLTFTTTGTGTWPAWRTGSFRFNTAIDRISNTGYTSDAAGTLTADGTGNGTHTYQWDAENRMTSIDGGATTSYTYNALGQRVEKKVGSTYTE